mmetsp:Transcript_33029/g.80278  ORF Transcript_33029/g.80278 Transcript_33029/m.80278 type:complete len:124 (+) Transcript_33029:2035-2406(+)
MSGRNSRPPVLFLRPMATKARISLFRPLNLENLRTWYNFKFGQHQSHSQHIGQQAETKGSRDDMQQDCNSYWRDDVAFHSVGEMTSSFFNHSCCSTSSSNNRFLGSACSIFCNRSTSSSLIPL